MLINMRPLHTVLAYVSIYSACYKMQREEIMEEDSLKTELQQSDMQ
jgi:hypothetical protein